MFRSIVVGTDGSDTADKAVDHEMIAAGHPDLYFELASFTAAMPRHWNEHAAEDRTKDDPFADVRMLAAGQAVQLREQLQRVARNAQGNAWPEFADLDCFACHHNLVAAKDSWRQERGYAGPGRRPFGRERRVPRDPRQQTWSGQQPYPAGPVRLVRRRGLWRVP